MSFTPEEAVQIKTDIEVLKNSTDKVYIALAENTEEIKEGNKLTHTLIKKIDESEIRRDYEAKERESDREYAKSIEIKVGEVNTRIDNMMPVYERLKQSQEFWKNIRDGATSTWGKMAGALIVIAVFTALGLDLSSIVK